MAQLSDIASPESLSCLPADYHPDGRPAEFVTEVFSPAPDCNHGEVFPDQQAWLDLVCLAVLSPFSFMPFKSVSGSKHESFFFCPLGLCPSS